MKLIGPQDAMFLVAEKRTQPMHVAALHIYTPPKGAGKNYVQKIYEAWRTHLTAQPPFSLMAVSQLGGWSWQKDNEFDIDYHLRHIALPQPGRIRELLVQVSRLHGELLDRSRPLWELYLIEGLADGRFALYIKLHHALVDGVSGIRMLTRSLSTDPKEAKPPIWAQSLVRSPAAGTGKLVPRKSMAEKLRGLIDAGSEILPGIRSGLAELRRETSEEDALAKAFKAPHSPFNVKISGARRFVAQSYPLARLRAIGESCGATLNDVVLALCAGTLRRYLSIHASLPKASLTSFVPVSLHETGGSGGPNAGKVGNQVALIIASLATNVADPIERLQRIVASTQAAKEQLLSLSTTGKLARTVAMLSPMLPDMLSGKAGQRPAANVLVSNVPGSKDVLYLNGARLDEAYPLNIPGDYMALSLTVSSYAEDMGFGFTACRCAVPNLQRMIYYLDESIVELEQAIASNAGTAKQVPVRTSKAASSVKNPRRRRTASADLPRKR